MTEQTFNLNFDGYWREQNINGIPTSSGVYCVYECTHNVNKGTVTIHRLLYIGEAADVNDRVKNHEKWNEWRRLVNRENEFCFSYAPVESVYRARTEAALIFKHKPPLNREYKDSFPFDRTTIITSGKNAKLYERFTVERTP
jgi:excinuclease UvrABC nuclease subunit